LITNGHIFIQVYVAKNFKNLQLNHVPECLDIWHNHYKDKEIHVGSNKIPGITSTKYRYQAVKQKEQAKPERQDYNMK